jgi:hypothetical protein
MRFPEGYITMSLNKGGKLSKGAYFPLIPVSLHKASRLSDRNSARPMIGSTGISQSTITRSHKRDHKEPIHRGLFKRVSLMEAVDRAPSPVVRKERLYAQGRS